MKWRQLRNGCMLSGDSVVSLQSGKEDKKIFGFLWLMGG
jgi:hypothetical protein